MLGSPEPDLGVAGGDAAAAAALADASGVAGLGGGGDAAGRLRASSSSSTPRYCASRFALASGVIPVSGADVDFGAGAGAALGAGLSALLEAPASAPDELGSAEDDLGEKGFVIGAALGLGFGTGFDFCSSLDLFLADGAGFDSSVLFVFGFGFAGSGPALGLLEGLSAGFLGVVDEPVSHDGSITCLGSSLRLGWSRPLF